MPQRIKVLMFPCKFALCLTSGTLLCCILLACWDFTFLPTNGFSIKPLRVKLLAGEQKATETCQVCLKAHFETLGFQRPLKEWSRSLDCLLPKDGFLRLALNIHKIMVFVAQELLRVRSLTVTPPSSSQLQMSAPKPLIPRLTKCRVASLVKIARCPAYRICMHRFFACWYRSPAFLKNAANLVASGHRCRSGMRCGLLGYGLSTLSNVLSTPLNVLSTLKNVLSMICPWFVHASFSFEID